jgi:TonB family protein
MTSLVFSGIAAPADRILLESRLFKGTRGETAAQPSAPVVISSFASPILVFPSPTPADTEAEFRSATVIKEELAEVYRQQNIEYLSTVHAIWDARRNDLRETLLLDNESYLIKYTPKILSRTKANLKVSIYKDTETKKISVRGAREGGEKIVETEIEVNFNEPTILGFPNNGNSYFLSVMLSAQPESGAGRETILKDDRSSLIGDVMAPPKSIRWIIPAYPENCKKAGLEGTVLLNVTTDNNGTVTDVRVMKSVHPDLDNAAQDALRHWSYEPIYKDGQPVSANFVVLVDFRMNPKKTSTGISPDQKPQKSGAALSPEMAAILQNCTEYCRKLANSALYFICEEKVNEDIYQLGSGGYSITTNADGTTTYSPAITRRKPTKNSYVYDYQLIKKGENIEEKRTLLDENGQKQDLMSAPVKTQRFFSRKAVFGPVGFLGREWHEIYNYELLKRERVLGREAYVIKATPKIPIEGKPNYGKLWVDAKDYSILKIEVEAESLAGIEKIEEEAKSQGLKPIFTTVHEFAVVKNGLRFPSRTVFEEKYTGLKNSFTGRTQSKTEIIYGNYRFFTVETEVVFK